MKRTATALQHESPSLLQNIMVEASMVQYRLENSGSSERSGKPEIPDYVATYERTVSMFPCHMTPKHTFNINFTVKTSNIERWAMISQS